MDINGQKYFLIREPKEFSHRSSRLLWNPQRGALTLSQNQEIRLPEEHISDALTLWETATSIGLDSYFQQCLIDNNELLYNSGRGYLPLVDGQLDPVQAEFGNFDDLALGGDDLLAATYADPDADPDPSVEKYGVLLFHLRKRWKETAVLPERTKRVWVDSDNRVWCLGSSQLYLCSGSPLPHQYVPSPTRFEPTTINPKPFALIQQVAFSGSDQPLAVCGNEETLFVLIHDGAGNQTILSRGINDFKDDWVRYPIDSDCPFAIDIKPMNARRFALMVPTTDSDPQFKQRDCAIVQLQWRDDEGSAQLIRERFPMLSQAQARFVSSADNKVRYQAEVADESEEAEAGFSAHARELLALQRPRFYTSAYATLTEYLDSGAPDTVWHRVYLEGCIPRGCKVRVYAKSYNNPAERTKTKYIEQPEWSWCAHRSDVAFGEGLVDAKENESGLFELLLQRNAGPVRRLSGRYMQIRVRLEGNGRNTPAIHALKVYYPRFSYQEAYLPEHFRQELGVDPALDTHRANGADVRERLLAAFEGALTPIETLVASSELLLSPQNSPTEHLPWLAELFGQSLPETWPEERKRRWIECTGDLQKERGTLTGVQLALDIITDGAVARGEVVVVENFRLRRTMATILGLNMDDENHPLTLGTGVSGNSIVGDSLILSDSNAREFLSLFAPELADENETEIVENFFDKYAHKVTVLLHGRAKRMRNSVETMLRQQMPAHLQWHLVETDHPFVLGLSPLLSVDTYLEHRPPARRVTLNDTYLGAEGVLTNVAAFSPQDVNA